MSSEEVETDDNDKSKNDIPIINDLKDNATSQGGPKEEEKEVEEDKKIAAKETTESKKGNDDDDDAEEINRMMALQQDSYGDGNEEHKAEEQEQEENVQVPAPREEENNNLFPPLEENEDIFINNQEDNDDFMQPIPFNQQQQQQLPFAQQQLQQHQQQQQQTGATQWYMIRLHYTKLSLLSAFLLIHHALRTRQQVYLALIYLTTSRLSYILLGNAIVALTVSTFQFVVKVFLNGLRPNEADTIGESMRWNVTETCLALTIFRSQVDVSTCGMFLILVLAKCLHWAAEIRGSQLRMTEETFDFPEDDENEENNNDGGNQQNGRRSRPNIITHILFLPFCLFFPKKDSSSFTSKIPRMKPTHFKFIALTQFLLFLDALAVGHCALEIASSGPSVHILFGFEAAILAVGAMNTLVLYEIHLIDGIFSVFHWYLGGSGTSATVTTSDGSGSGDGANEAQQQQQQGEGGDTTQPAPTTSTAKKVVDKLSISWRDHRATLTFATELLSQAAKFLFYVIFFAIVFTYYGMPINIFREVYMSYQSLRRRLSAFHSYRKLTYRMNERFESVDSEEELEELGRVCIICRDVMDCHGGCKKLPGCGHAFHRYCLREWLVQQQTCPTCRGDIVANEARAKAEKKRKEEEEQRKQQQEEQRQQPQEAEKSSDGAVSNAVAATESTNVEKKKKTVMEEKTPAFPCLYRVVASSGAAVFESDLFFKYDSVDNGTAGAVTSTSPSVVRVVSSGKIIVCTNMRWFRGENHGSDSGGDDKMNEMKKEEHTATNTTTTPTETTELSSAKRAVSGMMLEMPDGWVRESDLQRMLPIVLPDDDEDGDEDDVDNESFVEVEHDPTKAMSAVAVAK